MDVITTIATVSRDWLAWSAAAALAVAWCSLVYTAWGLRTVHAKLKLIFEEIREIREMEETAILDYRRQALAELKGSQFTLQSISEKLTSLLPPDVRVGSISAENLVVGPLTGPGR